MTLVLRSLDAVMRHTHTHTHIQRIVPVLVALIDSIAPCPLLLFSANRM